MDPASTESGATASIAVSARECDDALRDEDVTPLPGSQPHVVFRLRREEEDTAPWISELVLLLFNAQGTILQTARGLSCIDSSKSDLANMLGSSSAGVSYFGDNNLSVTRAQSKEALEREVVRLSVAKLHPYVEAVGCLVTYTEDEIARSPTLNAFSLTCDLHELDHSQAEAEARALAAGGGRFVFNPSDRMRLLDMAHDSKTVAKHRGRPNVVLICKLFRRHGEHHDWAFHAAPEDRRGVVVRSAVTATLVEAMQIFLLDLMPEIEIPNRNALSSVAGICAALSCNEFLGIERHFPEVGLRKHDFARLLLFELMRTRPALQRREARAAALVGLLFEMFEQIDINGDAVVDWEEFTSFCVALGLVATRDREHDHDHDQQDSGDSHDAPPRATVAYRQETIAGSAATRAFPYQVSKLKVFQQLKRLAVIEHKSSRILMYDLDLNFLHELNCSEKLAAEKKSGDKQPQDTLETLEVLDAEHVPTRNALAVASNDLCISVWSIIDATTGSYVFNGKLVGRFPALFVKWCPLPLKRLIVAGGSTEQVQLWDLEVPMHAGAAPPPPPMLLPRHHSERLADALDIPETPYVATASFDHTIALWEAAAGSTSSTSAVLKVAFVLRGHQQAVLTLDYAHSLLLSSGFEYQAYCWSVPGRTLRTKLGGHHHCLMGAQFVSTAVNGPCLVATGDQSGHFKLWDITRCAKGFSGNHLAIMLQTFELHTPNLCRFRMFAVAPSANATNGAEKPSEPLHQQAGGPRSSPESTACDIITGNLRLYRFRAVAQSVAAAEEDGVEAAADMPPTRCVIFNAVTNTFVGAVENRLTVWNANSGVKIEEPASIRDAEVCCMTFDYPRERKLFVATNDGAIRLYNPVTGALLRKTPVHEGPISSLLFCAHTNCLVSTGDDRALCMLHSPAGKAQLELLHSVEKAHDSSITCCACSPPPAIVGDTHSSRLVATGDDLGGVHVYDFSRLTLLFRCADAHTREVRALHFPPAASSLLVSGDAGGSIFLWATTGVRSDIAPPLMKLVLDGSPTSSWSDTDGVTSLSSTCVSQESQAPMQVAMIYAGSESGRILGWDLRTLSHEARRAGHSTRPFEGRRRRSNLGESTDPAAFSVGDPSPHGAAGTAARRNGVNGVLSGSTTGDKMADDFGNNANPSVSSVAAAAAAAMEAAEATAPLAVCPPTRSWLAHVSSVLSVQSLPWPGELFSLSADGALKVWDTALECVGHISTAGSQSPTAASAWKFVRHDHTGGEDEKDFHERIAREVIAKHQRRLRRHQRRGLKADHRGVKKRKDSLSTTLKRVSPRTMTPAAPQVTELVLDGQTSAMTNVAAMLLSQVPFSVTSVKSGIHQGLFGPEEAQQLRMLSHSSSSPVLATNKKKRLTALAPLFPNAQELGRARATAKAKAQASMPGGREEAKLKLAGARTLTNYPLELERRAGSSAAVAAAALRALDVEPSAFLREKLQGAASPYRQAAKSTPKKRLNHGQPAPLQARPRMAISMDASVVVLERNASLPKLERDKSVTGVVDSNSSQQEQLPVGVEAPMGSVVTPPLGVSASASALVTLEAQPTTGTDRKSNDTRRGNIERKMKLYEKLVTSVCLMTATGRNKAGKKPGTAAAAIGVATPPSPAPRRARSVLQLTPGVNPFGPHYTVKQVEEFAVVLARLDEDGSGDLDQREWTQLLQRCGLTGGTGAANTSAASVERLFHSLDRDNSGTISVRELLPTLFTRATAEQLQQMRVIIQARMRKLRGGEIDEARPGDSVSSSAIPSDLGAELVSSGDVSFSDEAVDAVE